MEFERYKFGLDVLKAASKQLEFLEEVNRFPVLQWGPFISQAIYRYEHFWLPLAARHKNKCLAAPLDIEWIWHCHMLSPLLYQRDCHTIVGCIIDHKLYSLSERKKNLKTSRSYWNQLYPSDPFEVGLRGDYIDPKYSGPPMMSYDVASAVTRQKVFYYQVSLPHFKDKLFLQKALMRYKKYLYLKKNNPGVFVVPCYDIDLIWHSHQLHPLIYKRDTETLLGKTFNHDDSVNDRSPGSKLFNADLETREIWKNTFNESFSMYGAMYRGDPPEGRLFQMGKQDIFSVSTKSAKVTINSLKLENMPNSMKFKLSIFMAANDNDVCYVASFKSPKTEWNATKLARFNFDTQSANCLKFRLEERTGFACFGSSVNFGENIYNLLATMEFQPYGLHTIHDTILLTSNGQSVTFTGTMTKFLLGPCLLFLQSGRYETCVMPETVEQLWGPVPLPRLSPGVNNVCEMASHKLLNRWGQVAFTCRVIHNLPLLSSAVHIFYHDKMSAVAHLIGSDQLPLPPLGPEDTEVYQVFLGIQVT